MNLIQRTNFYYNLFEKRVVPGIYSSIYYRGNPIGIYSQPFHGLSKLGGTFVAELFPTYFNFQVNGQYGLRLRRIFRVKGYCIAIDPQKSAEDYLKTHFKPNFRTSMRRRLKGLETCFDIRYRLFYGHITRNDYDFIMDRLHKMLVRRFNQRNDENLSLNKWNEYYTDTFTLINEKKASLYVIYDNKKPIQVSLSYHYENILFLSIPSYDIDYAKFGLGNIAIQKLLEWCIANGYDILDMGYGAFDYKVKWCNKIYDFEHHLFYRKSSLLSQTLVLLIRLKTALINYLLAKEVNLGYRRVKTFFRGKKKSDLLEFEIANDALDTLQGCKTVDPLTDDSYAFLRRAVYEFLYAHLEHVTNIRVYELERNESYVIKGVTQSQKIRYPGRPTASLPR